MVPIIMIRFDSVTVTEGGKTLLKNISFAVKEHDRIVFSGPSGSGKTTILLTIIGARIPSSGALLFMGSPVTKTNINAVRRTVSYISQNPVLGADTVRESLLLPFSYRANQSRAPSENVVSDVLSRLYLDRDILDRESSVVSGGEKQRIVIARSLLQQKKVFILDEATSALDPESKQAVLDLFKDSGLTVISASHDPEWITMCTRRFRIAGGIITDEDTALDTVHPVC